MSSQRLARQAYTKRWKRAQRQMKRVEEAVRAEMRAEQEAAWLRRRQAQLQVTKEIREEPELMVVPTYTSLDQPHETHKREDLAPVLDNFESNLEAYIVNLMRRMDRVEAKLNLLLMRDHSSQAAQWEDLLLSPCRTVGELEELDKSLSHQENKDRMEHYLGRLGGANVGSAIRRILRRVATNDVLAQYSLRGKRSKKAFQDLTLCKIITVACLKNFPDQTEATIEDFIGQVLKFAPHRRPTEKE
ncbi:uncharacterized protein LOC141787164 [Halichoeres trimaculatus]|uniref:uncharacterized protein LOC141787164 n=1 Tax=Halichoeres trimaculatus TaxID=147232 RepID=UPI003D9EC5D1